jgi:hypothetical protein
MDEPHTHGIAEFLARPQLMGRFTINNSTTFITQFSLSDFLSIGAIASKVAGLHYITCDFHVKLVVNANRFSFGRVIAAHVPFNTLKTPALQVKPFESFLMTSFPYVECDIGSGEASTIDIPYNGATPWYLTTGEHAYSNVLVQMLSPFVGSTGAETCTLTVFAWVDALQLSIPVPHGGLALPHGELEEKSKSKVSDTLFSVSDFAGRLVNLPLVGPIAEGVHWAAALSGNLANLFGYSKPVNVEPNKSISNVPSKGFTTGEGSSEAAMLAFSDKNGLSTNSCIDLCGEDPMSFPYFFSRFQAFETLEWFTGQPSGTVLFSQDVCQILDDNNSYWTAVATLFFMERGGMIFRLSAVKNAFYSGRLVIEYIPDVNASAVDYNPNTPNVVWDVSENREIYVRLPYVSPVRYSRRNASGFRGRLIIRVLNELRAENTMPQQIPLLLYGAPAPDYSLAVPANSNLPMPHGLADKDTHALSPAEAMNRAFALLDVPYQSREVEALVIGEPLLSLRTLIKRSTFLTVLPTAGQTHAWSIHPFHFDPATYFSHPVHVLAGCFLYGRGSMRYMVRCRQLPTTPAGVPPPSIQMRSIARTDQLITPITPLVHNSPPVGGDNRFCHITNVLLNQFHEVQIPYYSNYDRTPLRLASYPAGFVTPQLNIYVDYDDTVFTVPGVFELWQSVGDDFVFSFPCGNPAFIQNI